VQGAGCGVQAVGCRVYVVCGRDLEALQGWMQPYRDCEGKRQTRMQLYRDCDGPNDGHLREPGGIDRYLPWSEEVPDACRLSAAEAAKLAEMPDDPIIDIDPEPFDEV